MCIWRYLSISSIHLSFLRIILFLIKIYVLNFFRHHLCRFSGVISSPSKHSLDYARLFGLAGPVRPEVPSSTYADIFDLLPGSPISISDLFLMQDKATNTMARSVIAELVDHRRESISSKNSCSCNHHGFLPSKRPCHYFMLLHRRW